MVKNLNTLKHSESCAILDSGFLSFEKAWKWQVALVEQRIKEEIPNTLILCEHEPVYTVGRNYKEPLPHSLPFPIFQIERGGKITYHGPGQLIFYPIWKLEPKKILPFIRSLEQSIINLLSLFNIKSETRKGETGVWIGKKKIASIGIAVRHWVTFHGAALNVNPNLSHFFNIQPCGYPPETMTSLSQEFKKEISILEIKEKILQGNFQFDVESPR
jgi:lipoate-protein ligase B